MSFMKSLRLLVVLFWSRIVLAITNVRSNGAEWARQGGIGALAVVPSLAMAAIVVAPARSVGLLSFSLDLTGMVDFAETIFNSLSPIVVIVGGIVLGLGLVGLILSLVMKAVRGGGKA